MKDSKKISNLMLEKYLAGVLGDRDKSDLERMIQADDSLKQRVESIKRHTKQFCEKPEYSRILQKIVSAKTESNKSISAVKDGVFTSPFISWVPQLAMILLVTIALSIIFGKFEGDGNRIKGFSSELQIYLIKNNEQFRLTNHDTIRAGDLLQLQFKPGSFKYAVILSIDNHGAVFLHYPSSESNTARINNENLELVDHSYEINSDTTYEDFLLLLSTDSINVTEVLKLGETLKNATKLRDKIKTMHNAMETEIAHINVIK